MQQALLPLHLVTAGVGVAWLLKTVNNCGSASKATRAAEPGDAATPIEGTTDADLERSASQWLARSGGGRSVPQSPAFAEHAPTSYAELEVLAEGDFVYLRSGASVLTALVPPVRQLTLQPLQLAKGKPGSVPTAPLEAISVWLVRRCKQQVMFELLGPHDRRHILEADPSTPHGVALAGGSPGKRGRWLITPHGLASVRWPSHVLPLQVVTVQLFDARTVKSVRDGLGQKVAELATKLRQEEVGRAQAEVDRVKLEAELTLARNEAESQIAELRAQLSAAVTARHVAEREAAALQGQKADEAVRARMAHARASQAESEAQAAGAIVRRQEQQIQGMLAEHAEELRTLQQELQIAREANEGLKRAMREQIFSLQGALELRDARILELEEENDRMDTVLQVIQAQLGGGGFTAPERRGSSAGGAAPEAAAEDRAAAAPAAERVGGAVEKAETDDACCREPPAGEPSLSTMVGTAGQRPSLPAGPPAAAAADEAPLWRSLLDLTGDLSDLSVTALKESLAISRRSTVEDAPQPSGAWAPPPPHQPPQPQPAPDAAGAALPPGNDSGAECAGPVSPAERPAATGSVCGMAVGEGTAVDDWGSGGGGGDGGAGGATTTTTTAAAAGDEEDDREQEFVSAAARMSGHLLRLSGVADATPLRQQQPQVPGAAGGDVGVPSAARADPAGAGADAAARRGGSGGPNDGATAAARTLFDASGAAVAALAAAPGCSTAELEYGMEASLTLDSLRRRMRQLEAERQRLELLRVSLEESLPWRVAGGGGFASAGGAGVDASCASRIAFCVAAARSCGGAAAAAALANGGGGGAGFVTKADEQLGQKQQLALGRHDETDFERQGGGWQWGSVRDQVGKPAAQQAGAQGHQRPGASPSCAHLDDGAAADYGPRRQLQRRMDGGAGMKSPAQTHRSPCASAGGAAACSGSTARHGGALSPAAHSPGSASRVRCIAEQLLSRSNSSCEAARSPLRHHSTVAGGLVPHGCSSSGGDGRGASQRAANCAVVAAAAGDARLTLDSGGVRDVAAASLCAAALQPGRAGQAAGDSRVAPPRVELPCGMYDSIDGLCNLGSTRALPTARGAGWQTARKVAHSRQPSAGVAAVELPPLPMADAAPAAPAVATPRDVPAHSPGRPPTYRHAAGARGAAGGGTPTPPESVVGAATPKSFASTPRGGGGGDSGMLDDDALVHCDDQEPSPPPAMLLGPLEQLRSAGAAAAAAAAAAMDSGVARLGGRVLSVREEDDEAY